ncbi:alpha/beta fold hydrolase [Candidatus Nitrososphaera evergladensis]|nr:alpha/beta hydrolase [Candidatus Nitrososphaera evergladensis]
MLKTLKLLYLYNGMPTLSGRKNGARHVLVAIGIAMTLSIILMGIKPTIQSSFASKEGAITLVQADQSKSMATTNNNKTMSIVLVHGLWADASSWSKVIPILKKAGYNVIAPQLPLHSLKDDVATVNRAVELAGGPVILAGHSYAGFVITNAAYNNPNVKGLVYVSAFAPDNGKSITDYVDVTKLPKDLLVLDSSGFAYINPAFFHDTFAQDLDKAQTDVMAVVQKPVNQSIFGEKSGPPAWKQLPTWFQVSENDHLIPLDLQRTFAQQMNATTISLPSGHASLVSHPNEVAQLILNATKGASR